METYQRDDLVRDLTAIFPEFAVDWADSPWREGFTSLHSVYLSLMDLLGDLHPTPRQWQQLADHLSAAVAAGGDRENAADTCILEHLHQVKLSRILRPLLSKEARACVYPEIYPEIP